MLSLTDNLVTRNYTVRLFLTSILLTLSSGNFAFDNQGFAQTQAMGPFTKKFGDYNPTTKKYALPSEFLSLSNGIPFLVLIFGIFVGSEISARYGRRMTCFLMSMWTMVVCVPIILTSQNKWQFFAGRCLNSLYIGMEMSVIPVYQSEIVPAAVRGLAVASYQMSFSIGGLVISGLAHYTSTIPNDWSWKIIFLCYLFVPSILASLIWFQPESPRWLIAQGRVDDARRSLQLFRKPGHDIELEIEQVTLAVELEKQMKEGSYRSCFHGAALRRTMIVLMTNFFLQACGQAFTSLYGPIVIASIGGIATFTYTLVSAAITTVAVLSATFINDKVGRRPIMIIGSFFQFVFMTGTAVAGYGDVATRTKTQKNGIVACIILFNFFFGVGWSPINYVLASEVPSQQLRDRTSRMGFMFGVVIQCVVAISVPYMVNAPGNMGVKVGYVFGPFSLLACIWAYFYVPELKGLRLEQIDLLFAEQVSARNSLKWNKRNRGVILREAIGGEIVSDDKNDIEQVEKV